MRKRESKCLRPSWWAKGSLLWLRNKYYSQSIIAFSSNPRFNANTQLIKRASLIVVWRAQSWNDFPAPHTSAWHDSKAGVLPHTALLSEDWGHGTIQHLKTHWALWSPGPQAVLPPEALGEGQQIGTNEVVESDPTGNMAFGGDPNQKKFTNEQKFKMREVPLGWAGENVSTPHQQSQVNTAFMNNFGLFPFILCVIPTGLQRSPLHVISMK